MSWMSVTLLLFFVSILYIIYYLYYLFLALKKFPTTNHAVLLKFGITALLLMWYCLYIVHLIFYNYTHAKQQQIEKDSVAVCDLVSLYHSDLIHNRFYVDLCSITFIEVWRADSGGYTIKCRSVKPKPWEFFCRTTVRGHFHDTPSLDPGRAFSLDNRTPSLGPFA